MAATQAQEQFSPRQLPHHRQDDLDAMKVSLRLPSSLVRECWSTPRSQTQRGLDTSTLPTRPAASSSTNGTAPSHPIDMVRKRSRGNTGDVLSTVDTYHPSTPLTPGATFTPGVLFSAAQPNGFYATPGAGVVGLASSPLMQTPGGPSNYNAFSTPLLGTLSPYGLNGNGFAGSPVSWACDAGLDLHGQSYPGFLPSSMSPSNMTGNYGPAAAAAAVAAAGNKTGRTVYVGNLPGGQLFSDDLHGLKHSDASVDELLNLVRFGPIERIHLVPEKSCVFVSFLDGSTAAAFHADANVKKLALKGQELRIGWGQASHVPTTVMAAVQKAQATRNVFLGNLDDATTEETLRDDLSKFGPIDQVKIVRDKGIAFVHFLSIAVAIKVNTLLSHARKADAKGGGTSST